MGKHPPAAPQLPPFSVPQGSTNVLSIKPPFSFTGVTTAMFPLRASLDTLQQFCNNYMNIIPPELGRFRVPVPYVYLMMLDYGRMAIDVANVGWLAQREILFCILVEWYRVEKGQWVFQDWATICPFIYVDDEMSMTVGRNVYGWPKTTARLTPTVSRWMTDPLARITELTLSTAVFPELYAGNKLEEHVFLEVERARPLSTAQIPMDTANPMSPWTIAENVATATTGFARDFVGLSAGLGLMPMHPGSSGDNYMAMMTKLVETGFPLRPNLLANTINLKQFRRTEDPACFCYQALTNGPVQYTAFNRAGLFGQERVVLGDSTGGYTVKIHEWPSLPIINTLGLDVARRWQGEGVSVAELKPVLPFWYDVNMSYLPGHNVAWRTRDGLWHDREGREYVYKSGSDDVARRFNTTLGAGNKTVAGPFHFPDTMIRVMPLLARRVPLEAYVDGYLNRPLRDGDADMRFRLWGPGEGVFAHVYLTATSFGDVTSATDNIGDWAEAEVAVMIPVICERRASKDGPWELDGVGLVPAFTYLDSVTAVAARSEVLGIPATLATFGKPESAWMSEDGPEAESHQTLLRVDTEVLPVVGEGQKATRRTILSITSGAPEEGNDPMQWRQTADRWGAILKGELERKKALSAATSDVRGLCALSLELLSNRIPLSLYTMKQLRDVADAGRACYQSIVRIHRTLNEVLDIREIESQLTIYVNEFPTQPLVSLLGLVGKEIVGDRSGITYAMQPIRPFYMRVTMDEALGEPLVYRAGGLGWTEATQQVDPNQPPARPRSYFDDQCSPCVGPFMADNRDHGDSRRLTDATSGSGSVPAGPSPWRNMSCDDARLAVLSADPQTAIETILSREWGNWSDDTRWLARRRQLVQGVTAAKEGIDWRLQVEAEIEYLSNETGRRGSVPGKLPASEFVKLIPEMLEPIARARGQVEHASAKLFTPEEDRKTQPADDPAMAVAYFEGLRELSDLLAALRKVADIPLNPYPTSPDQPLEFDARNSGPRLRALNERLAPLDALFAGVNQDDPVTVIQTVAKVWDARDDLRQAVGLTRKLYMLQLEALLNELCRDAQKPDHVVRRDSAGPEADRVYPLQESWDRNWYAGSPVMPVKPGG